MHQTWSRYSTSSEARPLIIFAFNIFLYFRFAKIFGSSDIGSSSTRDIEPVPNNIVMFINQAAVRLTRF